MYKLVLIVLGLAICLNSCATYPKTIDKQDKANQKLQEKEKILRVFDKDKQTLLLAMERSKLEMFEAAKYLNDYIDTHKTYKEKEFKEYLSDKTNLAQWMIDKWWTDVELNYNLLKKMGEK